VTDEDDAQINRQALTDEDDAHINQQALTDEDDAHINQQALSATFIFRLMGYEVLTAGNDRRKPVRGRALVPNPRANIHKNKFHFSD